jgi:hypothetical protein
VGLTVSGALGEGILATGSLAGHSIGDVLIEGNRVIGNDLGGIPPTTSSPYPQCIAIGQVPGDCGEGIHLMSVYDNVISHNRITGNGTSGEGAGVLFANATAGTASYDNVVAHNYIAGNGLAGVTLHAHPLA